MNALVDVFLRVDDEEAWSVAVTSNAARVVLLGDTPVAFHWPGADGRERAVLMLRRMADQLEVAP